MKQDQAPARKAAQSADAARFSKRQLVLAFTVAGVSDGISVFTALTPPIAWSLDLLTALLLFAILGRQWLLLPGLILEAVPGLGVVPFWVLVVAAIAAWGTARPKLRG